MPDTLADQVVHNAIAIDILDRNLAAVGAGPLMTCLGASYSRVRNMPGRFTATFAARDPRTFIVQPLAHFLDIYHFGVFEFRGLVTDKTHQVSNDGVLTLVISGLCIGAELAEETVNSLDLSAGGTGVPDAPYEIVNTVSNSSWSVTDEDGAALGDGASITAANVYAKFSGETALQALIRVAEHTGETFRFRADGARVVEWLGTDAPDSGVRAVAGPGDAVEGENNWDVCYIQRLVQSQKAGGVVNRIYPYGGGDGEVRLTLAATNRTAAAGFTLDKVNNYLQNDTAQTALGGIVREAHIEFKDIRPVSNTDADLQAAANALYDAAYAYLQRIDTAGDTLTYDLEVLALPRKVEVGETMDVVYQDDKFLVDDTFNILAIETQLPVSGERLSRLTVAEVDRLPLDDTKAITNSILSGRIFTAHPQLNANSYATSYTKTLWNDNAGSEETAVVRFRLGAEVVQVQQVIFEFETADGTQMLPLESTVRSVGGSSTTTNQNTTTTTGASSTSSSGASSATTTASGGGSTPTSSSEATHTHDVTIAAHSHSMPTHYHGIQVQDAAGDHAVTYTDIAGTGGLFADGLSGNSTIETGSNIGGSTSDAGGSSTPTSASGTAHDHTVTIAAHTHNMPHTHNIDHTHQYPHDHDLTPNITTTYGKYQEQASLTFDYDHIVYRVNGGAWANLNDDVTGPANNWYTLDITAKIYDATTFRPNQIHNTIEFARKDGVKTGDAFAGSTERSCMIDGILTVRNIIQSIAYQ